jgi:hypothetical protein
MALSLPNSFTLLLVPEIDVLKNIADNGRHGNYVFDVNLSREVIKNVTAYVELWSLRCRPNSRGHSYEL